MSGSTQCSIITKQQNKQKSKPLKVGHYLIGQFLGRGGYANVYKAIQVYTQDYVAVKVIRLKKLNESQLKQLKTQISIHRRLEHPNIVKIYEVIWTTNEVYIFMEYLNGIELFQLIKNKGNLKEQKAVKVIYQLIEATRYIHSKGIAHRDIKAQNIIVTSDFSIKLIDFGLSVESHQNYLSTFCGSPSYIAPQLVNQKPYLGYKIDIWCIGIVLYVMLEGSLPFDHKGQNKINECIKKLKWSQPLFSSPQAVQFYQSIFVQSKQRKSIKELLQLPLLIKYFSNFIQSRQITNKKSKFFQNQISSKHKKVIRRISNSFKLKQAEVQNKILQHQLGEIYCIYNLLINVQNYQKSQRSKTLDSEKQKGKTYDKTYNQFNKKTQRKKTRVSIQLNNNSRTKTLKSHSKEIKQNKRQSTQKKQIRRALKVFQGESITYRFNQGTPRKRKQYIQISSKVSARIKYQNAVRSRIQMIIPN